MMLSTLSKTSAPFITAVSQIELDSVAKAKVIAAGVATAIAQVFPVSHLPVDNVSAYYNEKIAQEVRNLVGVFNEIQPFNVQAALEYARQFWTVRYDVVHSKRRPNLVIGEFFASITGATYTFSREELEFFDIHGLYIVAVDVAAREVVADKYQAENDNADRLVEEAASAEQVSSQTAPSIVAEPRHMV